MRASLTAHIIARLEEKLSGGASVIDLPQLDSDAKLGFGGVLVAVIPMSDNATDENPDSLSPIRQRVIERVAVLIHMPNRGKPSALGLETWKEKIREILHGWKPDDVENDWSPILYAGGNIQDSQAGVSEWAGEWAAWRFWVSANSD